MNVQELKLAIASALLGASMLIAPDADAYDFIPASVLMKETAYLCPDPRGGRTDAFMAEAAVSIETLFVDNIKGWRTPNFKLPVPTLDLEQRPSEMLAKDLEFWSCQTGELILRGYHSLQPALDIMNEERTKRACADPSLSVETWQRWGCATRREQ